MNEPTEIFDYAPIMIRMEKILREIHDNYLHDDPQSNVELIDQLIVEARLLRTYNLHALGM